MASRKRKENESYSNYKKNLITEAKEDHKREKGFMIWNSRNGTAAKNQQVSKEVTSDNSMAKDYEESWGVKDYTGTGECEV